MKLDRNMHSPNINGKFNSNMSVLFTLEFKYESASERKWQIITSLDLLSSVLVLLGMKMITYKDLFFLVLAWHILV